MAVAIQELAEQVVRHTFTFEQYLKMDELGLFRPDDRVELILGEVLRMMPVGPVHVACVGITTQAVTQQIGHDYIVFVQCAMRLGANSVPEPDFLVVRQDYDRSALPTPSDALLVIEVSDSSLAFDRNVRLPLYAGAGIPEAWIFDLVNHRIERHTDPAPDGYHSIAIASSGETLSSLAVPRLSIPVDAVLGTPTKTNE